MVAALRVPGSVMLSYQHTYHAGNLADVHKHWLLCLLLQRLQRKETPLCCIDTHAGHGRYRLDAEHAQRTGEYREGIARLWDADPAPGTGLAAYLSLVRSHNPDGRLRHYPGSPSIMADLLREQDRLVLLEMHPQAFQDVQHLAERGRIAVHCRDAFEGLPALVPPPERRGLVLIDPSYERKDEFATIPALLETAWKKWPQGVYALWYPVLQEGRHRRLRNLLARLPASAVLVSECRRPAETGLQGSGMVIINPPWQLDQDMKTESSALAEKLDATQQLDWLREPS